MNIRSDHRIKAPSTKSTGTYNPQGKEIRLPNPDAQWSPLAQIHIPRVAYDALEGIIMTILLLGAIELRAMGVDSCLDQGCFSEYFQFAT